MKPEKVIEKERIVCGITVIRREGDKTTNMLLLEHEISVTATNPEDAERLFKFAKKEIPNFGSE